MERAPETGTVRWFNRAKGYGFITPDQGNRDLLIHISALEKAGVKNLNGGQKIAYDVLENINKEMAVDITLIG